MSNSTAQKVTDGLPAFNPLLSVCCNVSLVNRDELEVFPFLPPLSHESITESTVRFG